MRAVMTYRLLFAAVFSLALANTAFANWWIVRSSDGHCLIVDLEPTGSGITKMGKEVYQTQKQAEADAKLLCKEPKAQRAKKRRVIMDFAPAAKAELSAQKQ